MSTHGSTVLTTVSSTRYMYYKSGTELAVGSVMVILYNVQEIPTAEWPTSNYWVNKQNHVASLESLWAIASISNQSIALK